MSGTAKTNIVKWFAAGAWSAALVLGAARPACAQDLEMTVSPAEVALGDRFTVTLIHGDPDFNPENIVRIEFEYDPERWTVASQWKRVGGLGAKVGAPLWQAELQGFEVGRQPLPDARALIRNPGGEDSEVVVSGAEVTIRSVLEGLPEEEQELKDLRGPVDFPRN
jgi:hypothetical protein